MNKAIIILSGNRHPVGAHIRKCVLIVLFSLVYDLHYLDISHNTQKIAKFKDVYHNRKHTSSNYRRVNPVIELFCVSL